MSKTHDARVITDPQTGLQKIVYVRTKETEEELERDRLGHLSMLKPVNHPDLTKHLPTKNLVVITPYLTGQRVIMTRLLYDKRPHKMMLGTQLVDSYVRSESYLEGFPQYPQLYIQFSYNESPNRRLADLVNEIMGLRFHLGMHSWLIVPRSIPELAAQWGDSLLNLSYLPRLNLPPQDGEEMGPNSSARTDPNPRPSQGGSTTSSMDAEPRSPDKKFSTRDRKNNR